MDILMESAQDVIDSINGWNSGLFQRSVYIYGILQQLFLDGNREGHQTQEKDDEKLKNECLLTKMPVVSRFSSL